MSAHQWRGVIEEYRDLSKNITKKKDWITEEEIN
mgnify:CR=1 FL=1